MALLPAARPAHRSGKRLTECGNRADAGDRDATRHFGAFSGFRFGGQEFFDSLHHLAHCADAARRVVRNVQIEFAFEREQDIDSVQRIDLQLLEALIDGHGLRRNLLRLGDHAGHAGNQVF